MENDKEQIRLSVVIPVYNSADTLEELMNRLKHTLIEIVGNNFEIIFVNDGSVDDSWKILQSFATSTKNTIAINLTRNYGQHNAIMCGLSFVAGDLIVTIDDDLQIPPEEIAKLYACIKKSDVDIVYGIYGHKKHSSFRNLGSVFVQWIYRKIFNLKIKITSFRIIKKEIVDLMLGYDKSFTYIDGLLCWFSKRINTIEVLHHERKTGKSGYSLSRLIVLALNMLSNFSIVPLQVASLIGISFSFIGFLFGILFLIKKILFGIPVSGFASMIISITIFAGVQLLTIGMLGEYIGRIHINVNKKPQYAIRNIIAMDKIDTEMG